MDTGTRSGLHSAEQTNGGRIFVQLLHTGVIGHPTLVSGEPTPVDPSAIAPPGQIFTPEGLRTS